MKRNEIFNISNDNYYFYKIIQLYYCNNDYYYNLCTFLFYLYVYILINFFYILIKIFINDECID